MGGAISGTKTHEHLFDQALRVTASRVSDRYDADSFSVGVVTNQSQKNRGGSTLFVNVPRAHRLVFIADQPVSIRLRTVSDPPIAVDALERFEPTWCEFEDWFLTTSAPNTNCKAIVV